MNGMSELGNPNAALNSSFSSCVPPTTPTPPPSNPLPRLHSPPPHPPPPPPPQPLVGLVIPTFTMGKCNSRFKSYLPKTTLLDTWWHRPRPYSGFHQSHGCEPQCWTMWWASSWIVAATTSRGWRTFITFKKIVSFRNERTQPTAWKSVWSQRTVVTPRGSTAFSRWTRAVIRFMTSTFPHLNLAIVMAQSIQLVLAIAPSRDVHDHLFHGVHPARVATL